jgi:hypothetical protein
LHEINLYNVFCFAVCCLLFLHMSLFANDRSIGWAYKKTIDIMLLCCQIVDKTTDFKLSKKGI